MRLFILLLLLIYSKSIFALSIDDSVKSTIANNLKVKIAFEKLNESKETIEVAIGKKLPTVTGTISGTYSNSDTTSAAGVSTTPETFTDKYKISITQNLYDGGEKSLEIERSKIIFAKYHWNCTGLHHFLLRFNFIYNGSKNNKMEKHMRNEIIRALNYSRMNF